MPLAARRILQIGLPVLGIGLAAGFFFWWQPVAAHKSSPGDSGDGYVDVRCVGRCPTAAVGDQWFGNELISGGNFYLNGSLSPNQNTYAVGSTVTINFSFRAPAPLNPAIVPAMYLYASKNNGSDAQSAVCTPGNTANSDPGGTFSYIVCKDSKHPILFPSLISSYTSVPIIGSGSYQGSIQFSVPAELANSSSVKLQLIGVFGASPGAIQWSPWYSPTFAVTSAGGGGGGGGGGAMGTLLTACTKTYTGATTWTVHCHYDAPSGTTLQGHWDLRYGVELPDPNRLVNLTFTTWDIDDTGSYATPATTLVSVATRDCQRGNVPAGTASTDLTNEAKNYSGSAFPINATFNNLCGGALGGDTVFSVQEIPASGPPAAPSSPSFAPEKLPDLTYGCQGCPGLEAWMMKVAWQDNSTNETGFALERRLPAQGSAWETRSYIAAAGGAPNALTANDYLGSDLAGKTFEYRIKAYNGYGASYSPSAWYTFPSPPPAQTFSITATASCADKSANLRLSWPNAPTTADRYGNPYYLSVTDESGALIPLIDSSIDARNRTIAVTDSLAAPVGINGRTLKAVVTTYKRYLGSQVVDARGETTVTVPICYTYKAGEGRFTSPALAIPAGAYLTRLHLANERKPSGTQIVYELATNKDNFQTWTAPQITTADPQNRVAFNIDLAPFANELAGAQQIKVRATFTGHPNRIASPSIQGFTIFYLPTPPMKESDNPPTLATDKTKYALGEPVIITVTNTTQESLDLSWPRSFEIKRDKTVIYLQGRLVGAPERALPLKPGESMSWTWDQKEDSVVPEDGSQVPAGQYQVVVPYRNPSKLYSRTAKTFTVTDKSTPTSPSPSPTPLTFDRDPSHYHSDWVNQSSSPSIPIGNSKILQIKLKNDGAAAWKKGVVRLASDRPADRVSIFDPGAGWERCNRIELVEDSVAPGETGTFRFQITATTLTQPGTYREYFRPVTDGVTWFPDLGLYFDVTVTPSANPIPTAITPTYDRNPSRYNSSFVSQSAHPTLAIGESTTLEVKLKNSGAAAWKKGVVRLASDRPADRVSIFDPGAGWERCNRIELVEDSVAPGETGTFRFQITATTLTQPGTYREYFRPVTDGVTWFPDLGLYFGVTITE